MAIDAKFEYTNKRLLRDTRPLLVRINEGARKPENAAAFLFGSALFTAVIPPFFIFADLIFFVGLFYFIWLFTRQTKLPYRNPQYTEQAKADGIMFIGNTRTGNRELWISNSDARTHILYLGTTGSGKTEGLKSLASNALCWGSGFVYVDGKADTDLWGSMYSMCRRFGREDDLLVLNYMTGNSDMGSVSNSMNPFSAGSASYLVNMMVGLMEEAGGDNAMWKGRAISLMSALMPALTYKRDNQGLLLDVQVIRDSMGMEDIIRMSRDANIPDRITRGLKGYLRTLPGYVDEAFDDSGNEKANSGADMTVPRQQHGYLTMQFTRALGSLADDYGHVFKTQLADIDMIDVVLNRRVMIVLIPALEKSADESANLGKIIAATMKGMMGSALGASVEGEWDQIIENKITKSSSPFLTIFDEVGYYTAQGMAVMAAQARSLGFSLVFAAQDLPAMEKRVKEEARSITANCNMKIFGKLEDPTQTREFFENTVGGATIAKISQFEGQAGSAFGNYRENMNTSLSDVKKASYGELKGQKEGQAHIAFMADTLEVNMFYANPSKARALRVHRFMRVSPNIANEALKDPAVNEILKRFKNPEWVAGSAGAKAAAVAEIDQLHDGFALGMARDKDMVTSSILAVTQIAHQSGMLIEQVDDDDDELSLDKLIPAKKAAPAPDRPAPLVSLDKEDDKPEKVLSWADLVGPAPSVPEPAAPPAAPPSAEQAAAPALPEKPVEDLFAGQDDNLFDLSDLDLDSDDDFDFPDFSSFMDDEPEHVPAAAAPPPPPSAPPAPRPLTNFNLEDWEAPAQTMSPFMQDMLKRAGSVLSRSLSAAQKEAA